MADNRQRPDNSGNVLVESDYQNIIIVDPNRTIDAFGNISERLVDHENLVMYANLEADVVPRTKLAIGFSPQNTPNNPNVKGQTVSIAKINFLRPTEGNYLSTGYYDELTGKNSPNMKGQNQLKQELVLPNKEGSSAYWNMTTNAEGGKTVDDGLLGITSIRVTTNTSFIPTVEVEMEDIQGRALFQLGDNSPYAAFFNMPYCPFYLTLKGYFGQAIRYQLNIKNFNARFNSFSGNYSITVQFVGYKFNILNEISVAHLLAAPHMYGQRYSVTTSPTAESPNNSQSTKTNDKQNVGVSTIGDNNIVTSMASEKGYQKIVEVYSEYKAKGLIPKNFPELTLVQLMNKLRIFEQSIASTWPEVDLEPLTNIKTYKKSLNEYFNEVMGGQSSWFNTYLNPKPIVLNNGHEVFTYKQNLDETAKSAAKATLAKIITDNNKILAENATLGDKGTTPIINNIKYETLETTVEGNQIDWEKTIIAQTNQLVPTLDDIEKFKIGLSDFLKVKLETINGQTTLVKPTFFIFNSIHEKRFQNSASQMEAEANRKLSEYESALSAKLAAKLEDKASGLGFKPTVRNIIAVIMASAEGFIRLLDDVHSKAWEVKYDPIRKLAIQNNTASIPSSDVVKIAPYAGNAAFLNQGIDTSQDPVYPWPQFFVEDLQDAKGRFQLKYPADPSVVRFTQGWDFVKWPEVEFVEEYMRGLNAKFIAPLAAPPLDSDQVTNIININAIEYPEAGIAYVNKEEIKFFYEIWERQFLTSHYSGFNRVNGDANLTNQILNLNVEAEAQNITNSLGVSSPYITSKLKTLLLNSTTYPAFLNEISNFGTGKAYQDYIRDFFITPYIRSLVDNPFSILSVNDIGKIPQNSPKSEGLAQLVKSSPNEPLIVDTYPFTVPIWNSNNLSLASKSTGNDVYNTSPVLQIFKERNVVSNFNDIYNYSVNRPVTNFSYLNVSVPTVATAPTTATETLYTFYFNRTPNKFVPTEGYLQNVPPVVNSLPEKVTTSILNTPYFINAIQNGVYNERKDDAYPYIQAAYLFLNSLPLASLRERYKTNGGLDDLPYIASCLKKFGAIHKMPYAWVLKFGSIWHRYKKYKESNVDILSTAWTNYDYTSNYSPITKSTSETYSFTQNNASYNITLQSVTPDLINIQPGFYPKTINDFNYFYNGYDLYINYTNEEIQKSVNRGMRVFNLGDSNITLVKQNGVNLNVTPYSVLIPEKILNSTTGQDNCPPANNSKLAPYFIVPSFGSNINQTSVECINNGSTVVDLTNNKQMYNGSVRLLWAAPNYGYFDNTQSRLPQPDAYMNFINPTTTSQSPMHLLSGDTYSKIEEVFSVFEKSILDQFEDAFLKFSKPATNIDLGNQTFGIGVVPSDIDKNFKNFQLLMRSLMVVNPGDSVTTNQGYYNTIMTQQLGTFSNGIKSFMEYDVILRYGNPSNYRRRVFDSFLSWGRTAQAVTDPINFEPYVKNSLPSKGGITTLSQSKQVYPNEWRALELEVGFSTISGLEYTSNGSYITDFFIDNNIKFSTSNITLCAPLIKMYATQKQQNIKLNNNSFVTALGSYIEGMNTLQNNFLNTVMVRVQKDLPYQQQLPEKTLQTIIDGNQSKIENYEVFKALNDKWIAGSDYKEKTLFEDIMFLDRASRNIGDKILLDIFDLQNMINENALNMQMSVFTLISGILIKNNFNVMPLPAYTNFYNVQDVSGLSNRKAEGSLEFANNMWGTFLDVDYRASGPKLVCFYVGLPSAYLDLPKGNFRFRNDGFDIHRASECPLIENLQGKTDFALSNRCVGFNVDIGIRNQNIFYSFAVDMNTGKATSESIQAQVDMVDQANGRNVTTQNNSLYNLYKRMSYTCNVTCLGNALIQPTMYFNLRHVPMFYGPYMITDVTHTITAGNFQTNFVGIRQGFYDLPTIDKFLQSINQNLLSKIEALVVTKKDTPANTSTTNNAKSANIQQSAGSSKAAENSCRANLSPTYSIFSEAPARSDKLTPKQLKDLIVSKTKNKELQTIIYCYCYIRTFKDNVFYANNSNFATITLNANYDPLTTMLVPTYSCMKIGTTSTKEVSQPIAHFESNSTFMDFMVAKLKDRVSQILEPSMGLARFYACFFPTDNISVEYYNSHVNEFTKLKETLTNAIISAESVGLYNFVNPKTSPLPPNVTPTPAQSTIVVCPPPTITSFTPKSGKVGTIVTVNGSGLDFTTSAKINGAPVPVQGLTVIGDNQIKISVPSGILAANNPGLIEITTSHGVVTSGVNNKFTVIP